MQIVILVLVGLFLVTSAQAASAEGRVFYDGFESGVHDPVWVDGYSDGPGIIPAAGNKGHDGTLLPKAGQRQMECWYGTANQDLWYCKNIPISTMYTNEIFIRTWMRLDQDVQHNQGSMAHLLRWVGSPGSQIAMNMVSDGSGGSVSFQADNMWQNTWPSNSPCYLGFFTGIGDRQWHKHEQYLNNATHVYKLWQDDVLICTLSIPQINVHFPAFTPLNNWGSPKPTDNNTHFYFDEIEVYSDLGTGGSGSMLNGDITQGGSSDTTPPSSPVNLRVQ